MIGLISIPIMIYYIDKKKEDYKERDKVVKELYSHIKSFISMYEEKEGQFIDFDMTKQIGQEVISTIVHRKDLQKHIQKYFIYYSLEYIDLVKIVFYITTEFLYHYHNLANVEQMLYFVINNILEKNDNLHIADSCINLVSATYYQYVKTLEHNNKISESQLYFKKLQSTVQENSYMQIQLEHLLNRRECKNIIQEIKNLNIQYNLKLNKFEISSDVDKSKVAKLIQDNAAYIMKYESLKANNQFYVLDDYVGRKKCIIPTEYPQHQMLCQKMLLKLYTTSLLLKSVLGIKDQDDIKHIANLIKDLQQSLESKENKYYSKMIHCVLLDTLDIVGKCTEHDDELNKKAIKLMKGCITKIELRLKYEAHAQDALDISYNNSQFHCLQDKIDRTDKSKMLCGYMKNCDNSQCKPFLVSNYSVIGEVCDCPADLE